MKSIFNADLTKEFKEQIETITKENSFEYKAIVSFTSKNFYDKTTDEQIIKYHLEHISSDYLEEYGYETVLSHGYIKNRLVVGEFLFRRKK